MAIGARVSLLAVRGLLKAKHVAPTTVAFVLPYVTSFTNSVLQIVENKGVQNKLLRKGLLAPTENETDLRLWKDDNVTRAWLRRWWLTNTFRGTPRYHAASAALHDASILPTLGTTKKIFQMKGWKFGSKGDPDADEKRQWVLLGKIEAAKGDMSGLSTLELLEAAGCAIDKRGSFNAWCESHETFEFLTNEYVSGLAAHIWGGQKERSAKAAAAHERGGTSSAPSIEETVTVLELGAGDGRLSHFLRPKLASSLPTSAFRVVATDNGSWKLKGAGKLAATEGFVKVEKLDFAAALAKHAPQVVLTSWMPMGQDWTEAIRATPSVQEYILIGEADGGCCGHNWKTWGNSNFIESGEENSGDETQPLAPFVADGWTRHDVTALSQLQLSRFDSEEFVGSSCTVSFKRKAEASR
mmetsp:Transcript_48533/g.97643  ORF Transcript_48533/g.97643 Transcript_48533/m.97643 type:complete len:412 (-) Transcript_48533:232-1467(-)|eukprot:CAMPEP_0171728016 /NCGR_PEP_ID=MMETSP0991-20121206/26686_1 /TAXON_ID=483369 /ORGANISM="non described non described, Strain CCMP2098" /LENGTH=411 /DNA_ID=CAMNT_0012321961 /DNA_START=119 /DNA_END=1354 /DNA_ORIENTATION=-